MTPAAGAGLAWAAFAIAGAAATWPSVQGPLRGIAECWVAGPGWTWGGAALQLLRIAGVAALALATLAAGLGAGSVCAPLITRRRIPPALSIPLGLGLAAATVAGLGFAGLMRPGLLAILAAATLIPGVAAARRPGTGARGLAGAAAAEPLATVAVLALTAALGAALATLPDSHEDPLVYHWAAPEAYLRAGRIYASVQHFQWHGPLAVEMLFAIGLSVAGVAGLKAVNLALIASAVLGAAALARALNGRGVPGSRSGGWIAAAILALSPAAVGQCWSAKNDFGTVAWWTAAAVAMLQWSARSSRGAVLSGAFAGFCASTKYTAAFPLAGLAVWFAIRRPGFRRGALAAGAAAVFAAPWLARNWLETRDPVYPLASSLVGGLWWGPEYDRGLHSYARGVSPAGIDQPSYWLLAWREAFADPAELGVAAAALAPAALVLLAPGGAAACCAAATLAFLAFLAERNARFLLPLLPVVAAAGELCAARVRAGSPRLASAGWNALAAAGAFHLAARLLSVIPPMDWPALAAGRTGAGFLSARYTAQDDLRTWCAARLPAAERIMLTGSDQRFGFRQEVVSSHVVCEPLPWRWAKESFTDRELAKKWRQAGIRVVAHNLMTARFRHQGWFTGPAWTDRMVAVYRAFAARHLAEIHRSPLMDDFNGFFYVLRVEARPRPPLEFIPVLPWTESLFAAANRAETSAVMREQAIPLARAALSRLPDVGDAIEQAASIDHDLGRLEDSLFLGRILASHGFDGETNWCNLAIEESLFGNRAAAFSALRRRMAYAPFYVRANSATLGALYLNWAESRERAGDPEKACLLIGFSLRALPNIQESLALARRLGCGGRRGR